LTADFEKKAVGREMSKRKLLVVEDSMTTRDLMRSILSGEGYQVDVAVDGLDAMEKIARTRYDLLVSDIEMPRMNGLELCRTLKANESYKNIPFVFLTALASEEEKRRGIEAGAQAYIVKSGFDQTNLLSTISRLII
jgi:two-component system chemotaxis sensor kinase CheA